MSKENRIKDFIHSLRSNALELTLGALMLWWTLVITFQLDSHRSVVVDALLLTRVSWVWSVTGFALTVVRMIGLLKHNFELRRLSAAGGIVFWSTISTALFYRVHYLGAVGTFGILAGSCLATYLILGIEERFHNQVRIMENDDK